jgi:endoglycosylceramidase
MSFHNYYATNFQLPIQNALDHQQENGEALLMTEFGASQDPTPVVAVENLADEAMMGWCYWAYANNTPYQIVTKGQLPPKPEQQGVIINLSLPRTGSNVNQALLSAISRPYPQTIVGTPQSFSFDPETGKFVLSYSTSRRPKLANRQTIVAVPAAQYPNGYTAMVSGGRVVSPANNRLLRIVPTRLGDPVSVTILPR